MDPTFGSSSVSGSNFGDQARLHIGDYNVNLQDKPQHDPSNPSAHDDFLSDLSSIDPMNQGASVKRLRTQTVHEVSQTWSAITRFNDWFFNSKTKYLWVQDETLRQEGGALLVSDIIKSLQEHTSAGNAPQDGGRACLKKESPLAYFYCSCTRDGHIEQWAPSHVLGGLISMLVQGADRSELLQGTVQKYGRRLKASLVDHSNFSVLVEILLHVLGSFAFSSLPTITLIVEAIDQCGADSQNIGITDLLDIVNQSGEQVPNLKWVISSRATSESLQMLGGLESDCHLLKISYTDVLEGLGFASTMETVLAVGSRMKEKFEFAKSQVQVAPDEYGWFQYSKAGANWLKVPQQQDEDFKGPNTIWYERSRHLAGESSPVALHMADIVCSHVGLELHAIYYDCHFALPTNLDSSDSFIENWEAQPAVALFCTLSQIVHVAVCHGYSWAKVVVDLPKRLRRALESLLNRITKARTGYITVIREIGTESGETIEGITTGLPAASASSSTPEYHRVTTLGGLCEGLDFRDGDIPDIVELIDSVASKLPNDILLIFDSLEHMNWRIWMGALHVLTDKLGSRVRILLCGKSKTVDRIFSAATMRRPKEWKIYVGRQVDKHSQYPEWRMYVGSEVNEHSEYKECLQSLHFDAIHTRRDSVTEAWPNTNKWLWDNTSFKKWVATGGLLWIHGKAGSGKSVLAKTILKEIGQRLGPDCEQMNPWFICDWFYNARGTEIGKLHSSMLRSLAYEILRYDERAFETAKIHYRALDHERENPVWSLSALTSLLHDLAASLSTRKTIAVIDALDESENGCDGTPENRLSTVQTLCEMAGRDQGQLRIIVLSRTDPLMASHLTDCHQINMQEHNYKDIGAIVGSGLDSIREVWASVCGLSKARHIANSDESLPIDEAHFRGPADNIENTTQTTTETQVLSVCQVCQQSRLLDEQEEELEEIRKHLVSNASGVVLWVCLVVHELRECIKSTEKAFTLKDLTETCYRLPGDLNDLYAHMILGLNLTKDSQKTMKTKKILMWIIGSAPWGSLTLRNLWEALALPEETTHGREWSRRAISRARFEIGHNWDRFCQIIHRYCGPLVEIKRDYTSESQHTWTVHLLHQTTKTFLGNEERSGNLYINSDLASILILDCCHLYLGLKAPHPDKTTFKDDLSTNNLAAKNVLLTQESLEILQEQYARDRPLYDFAMRVVQGYIPFRRFPLMESIQGGDGMHDLRDCFVIYYILDAFHDSAATSEAHDIRGFFCQCCLRGGVDMLKVIFELVEKFPNPITRPRISSSCAYETIRGAVEALLLLDKSSPPNCLCIWHPTLQNLVECYSRHSAAVDTTSTGARGHLDSEDMDEPIDAGLDFLEGLQKRCLECTAHTSYGDNGPGEKVVKIHGECVNVSMGRVYEAIGHVIEWLELVSNHDRPQYDLDPYIAASNTHRVTLADKALESRKAFMRMMKLDVHA